MWRVTRRFASVRVNIIYCGVWDHRPKFELVQVPSSLVLFLQKDLVSNFGRIRVRESLRFRQSAHEPFWYFQRPRKRPVGSWKTRWRWARGQRYETEQNLPSHRRCSWISFEVFLLSERMTLNDSKAYMAAWSWRFQREKGWLYLFCFYLLHQNIYSKIVEINKENDHQFSTFRMGVLVHIEFCGIWNHRPKFEHLQVLFIDRKRLNRS